MDQWVRIQDIFDATDRQGDGSGLDGWFPDELIFEPSVTNLNVNLTLKSGYVPADVVGKDIRGTLTSGQTQFPEETRIDFGFGSTYLFISGGQPQQTITALSNPAYMLAEQFNIFHRAVFQVEIFTTPIVAASEFWTDYKGTREIDIS